MLTRFESMIKSAKSWLQKFTQKRKQQQLSNFVFDYLVGDREFYIAFTNPDEGHMAERFLKPGFRHCFIFFKGERCWLMLNPTRWFLHVMELSCIPSDPFPNYLKENNPDITILRVVSRLDDTGTMYFRPLTCVSHTAYIIGLTKRFVITPYQLYRCLLKGGNPNITQVQEII